MPGIVLHITLAVVVDRDRWLDGHLIIAQSLSRDVAEYVEQAVKDTPAAHLEGAITSVETVSVVAQ